MKRASCAKTDATPICRVVGRCRAATMVLGLGLGFELGLGSWSEGAERGEALDWGSGWEWG